MYAQVLSEEYDDERSAFKLPSDMSKLATKRKYKIE